MILFFHLVFGAVWGVFISNFWLAVILAFLTHYLLDRLPHWEYNCPGFKTMDNAFMIARDLFKVSADFFLGIALVIYLSRGSAQQNIIIAAAFAGALPDAFLFLYWVVKRLKGARMAKKALKTYFIHHLNNHWDITKRFPKWWELASPTAVLILSVVILSFL